jgi:methyl-accepting chemotaxis protein
VLKKILLSATAFLSLVLVIWLAVFINIPSIHQAHHQAYLDGIQSIEKHFAQMQAEMLRTRFGEVKHYDYVQHNYIELQRHVNSMLSVPDFVDHETSQKLTNLANAMDQQVKDLEFTLSDFNRANSLLRNSVAYLPTLIKSLQEANPDTETKRLLDLIEKTALSFYIYQDADNANKMKQLQAQYMAKNNKPLQASTLPIHTDVLLIYTQQAAAAMKKIGAITINHNANQLRQDYEAAFNAVNSQRNTMMFWSEIILFAFIVALLAVFAYAVFLAQKQLQSIFKVAMQEWGKGHFNYRMPLRGDDSDVITQQLNAMFTHIESAHKEIQNVTNALASGKFDVRIEQTYEGDLDNLKEGVNASAESVSFMMNELEKIMRSLHEGNFSVRMDKRVPNQFREQVDSALVSMHQIINAINDVMQCMNNGDFNTRVDLEARGDFAIMKLSVNGAVNTLDQMTHELLELANAQAQGDLATQAQGNYKGRLQELQQARIESTNSMRQVIINSRSTANSVGQTAELVLNSSANLSHLMQQQVRDLEQTSGTMHIMASAVQENTINARKVADLAHQVQHQSGQGVQVMQETIAAMQSISEASHKIGDIVTLIDGIAFQTNLLALNAAVEAARAGEHGRGFAVVASEVRALAQKSAEAAKDIKHLIDDSVDRIEVGTTLADKSGEMLGNITNSVEQVANMIEQIATASQEQSRGISQVHQAIANLDKVTQENTQLVEDTRQAAETLNTEADQLRNNIGFFKT